MKVVSEILDEFYDPVRHCYSVVVEYTENVLHKGWTSISYGSKEQADKELFVGMRIREGL